MSTSRCIPRLTININSRLHSHFILLNTFLNPKHFRKRRGTVFPWSLSMQIKMLCMDCYQTPNSLFSATIRMSNADTFLLNCVTACITYRKCCSYYHSPYDGSLCHCVFLFCCYLSWITSALQFISDFWQLNKKDVCIAPTVHAFTHVTGTSLCRRYGGANS